MLEFNNYINSSSSYAYIWWRCAPYFKKQYNKSDVVLIGEMKFLLKFTKTSWKKKINQMEFD